MGSCVSISILFGRPRWRCHITEYVSLRDIEEHDRLAAEDKTKLVGGS